MAEQLANNAQSVLPSAITSVDTFIPITDLTSFPTTGTFRILIEHEIMMVMAIVGGTLQVVRAQEGTTAAAHATGTLVTAILTKAGLTQFVTEQSASSVLIGNYSARPAPNTVPYRQYMLTDGLGFSVSDGALWHTYGIACERQEVPNIFTWHNQGSSTVVLDTATEFLNAPALSGDSLVVRETSIANNNFSFVIGICPAIFVVANACCGIVIRDSTSNKHITFGLQFTTTLNLSVDEWTNDTTHATTLRSVQFGLLNQLWLQIYDDTANTTFFFSTDGIHFREFYSFTTGTFLTPDNGGYFVNSANTTFDAGVTLFHWFYETFTGGS